MKTYKLLFLDFELPYLLKDAAYPVGGACVRQYALAKGIASLGHKVGILTWKGANNYIQKEVEFDLIEAFSLSKGSSIGIPSIGISKLRWFYHVYPKLYYAIKYYQPDIVFLICSGLITGVMAIFSKWLGIPFVNIVACDTDADGRYKDLLRYIEIKLYEYAIENAEQIIVQNNYQKKEIHKKWKDKKIALVHNPFFYENALPKIEPKNKRTYIAWIGRFQYQKNLPDLLNIIKETPNMEFRIAGTLSAKSSSSIKKTVEDIANCKNVKLLGYISRSGIIPFLANALVLLNTSHYEGFPNTFLESFAAGTPVVTNRIDPDNIITNNEIGIVAQNCEEIPEKLNEMLHKNDYNEMAERCRHYVLKNHNFITIAEKFMESISGLS